MRVHCVVLCSLILLCATSCSSHKVQQPSSQKIAIRVPETAPEPLELTAKVSCPTEDDVRASLTECQKLIDEAQCLVRNLRSLDATSDGGLLIARWNEKEKAWKAKNDLMIANCELLLGANGTPVFPQIPLALRNLNRADDCLSKSLEAATLGHRIKARAFIKGARIASNRATQLLDGN